MTGALKRRGFTLAIFLALLLAMLGLIARRTTGDVTAEASQSCMDVATRDHIRQLMNEGLDQAFRTHLIELFDVWMKDRHAEPVRARRGMNAGISAYARSRKSAMTWQPSCVM
jgi:hypothetical protein